MKLYYRVSDKSYPKQKLLGATKRRCLENFRVAFQEQRESLTLIADRCSGPTLDYLKETGLPIIYTDLGNAGSFHKALDLALQECHDGELVYFVEDDYLHLPNSSQLIREGAFFADYITLYDHPDKYTNLYGMGETSKVVRTNSSHWRFTVSTCMTFAGKANVLKEDIEIFKRQTNGEHPLDHLIFADLKAKGRKLAVCIPGAACHTDLTFSGMAGRLMLEPWAIEMMLNELGDQLKKVERRIKDEDKDQFTSLKEAVLKDKKGWDLLVGYDALLKTCKEK